MAALLAEDISYISGFNFLQRGYEDIILKLQSLNADIQRVEDQKKENIFLKSTSQYV